MERFFRSLTKIAKTSNALILTEGYNYGIPSLVGDKIRDGFTLSNDGDGDEAHLSTYKRKYRLIGFPHWGVVKDRVDLTLQTISHHYKGRYEDPDRISNERIEQYVMEPKKLRTKQKRLPDEEGVYLNPDHSHFVMPDDGKRRTLCPKEPRFFVKVLNNLQQQKENQEHGMFSLGKDIPSVCVLINGGPKRIDFANLCVNETVPLIVCKGTGRAADVLAEAYGRIHKENPLMGDGTNKEAQKILDLKLTLDFINKTLFADHPKQKEGMNKEKLQMLAKTVNDIMENHGQFVIVYDVAGTVDFDYCVLKAILRLNQNKPDKSKIPMADLMTLAFRWDRSDFAEEKILARCKREDIERTADQSDTPYFETMMENSLLQSKLEFTELLISHGMVTKFLTGNVLLTLYQHAFNQDKIVFKFFTTATGSAECTSLKDCYKFVSTLISYHYGQVDEINMDEHIEHPIRDLFIWAVIFNHPELAEFFWRKMDHPVMIILMGGYALKSLIDRTSVYESERREEYSKAKDRFEQLANSVISKCASLDVDMTKIILRYKHEEWGLITCMDAAAQADCKLFLGSHMCQEELQERWDRRLRSNWYSITSALFLPLIVGFIIQFDLGDTQTSSYAKKKKRLTEIYRWAHVDDSFTIDEKGEAGKTVAERFFHRLKKKYSTFYKAPKTKFIFTSIMEVLYLCFFAYFLLFDYHNQDYSGRALEYFLHFWTFTILVEEVRSIFQAPPLKIKSKFEWWARSVFSFSDSMALILYLIAFTMRLVIHNNPTVENSEDVNYAAKVLFAFSLFCFFMHLFNLLNVSTDLGPQVLMVGQMLLEIRYYLVMLLVFFFSFGVFHEAILHEGKVSIEYKNFKAIAEYSWWPFIDGPEIDELFEAEERQWPCPSDGHHCYIGNSTFNETLFNDDFNETLISSRRRRRRQAEDESGEGEDGDGNELEAVALWWMLSAWLAFWVLLAFTLMNLLIAIFSSKFLIVSYR